MGYFVFDICGFADVEMIGAVYMFVLKNGVLLRNRKAENRPLMKVICSLLLLAPCLSALVISCFLYFLITINPKVYGLFLKKLKFPIAKHNDLW